eukprot:PITA_33536
MSETISRYVKGCAMCAKSKPSNRKLGLYTPLLVPSHPWESISMDFVGELPKSGKGHDYLYIFVDKFSKMCILIPCSKQITAKQTSKLFFEHVWVHFGLPTSIVSNRDTRFVGKFWSSLWELMDTKLKKSTAFHPQTDGQTEVVNKTMIQLLRGYCSKHPKLWDEHVCYVQHGYNRAKHSSTQRSPFETCFGFIPRSPLDFVFGKDTMVDRHNNVDKETRFIEQIQEIHQVVQEQLEKSQAKYGPFKILEKIGENAFRLDLPAYMHIFSVVNVDCLRLFEPSMIEDPEEQSQLPSIYDLLPEYLNELQEDTMLDRKVRTTRSGQMEYLRIGLKGSKPSSVKWIEIGHVRQQFPHLVDA